MHIQYRVRRQLLILIVILCCGCENGISWVTVRPLWRSDVRRRLRDALCVADSAYRVCFKAGEEECSGWMTESFDVCAREFEDKLPFFFIQPRDGRKWGAELGGCVGDRYHDQHESRFQNTPACMESARKSGAVSTKHKVDMRLEAWLGSYELGRVAAAADPAYREQFRDMFKKDTFDQAIAQKTITEVLGKLQKYAFLSASNAAMMDYARAHLAAMRSLEARNPELCRKNFFAHAEMQEPDQKELLQVSDKTLFDARQKAIVELVSSGVRKEGTAADEATLETVVAEIRKKMPEEDAIGLQHGGANTCKASIAFYEALLQLPAEKTAPVLKTLLTKAANGAG